MVVLFLTAEFFLLYLVSRWLTQTLFFALATVTRSQKIALSLMTTMLFPGTIIHELSHLFTAEILGVRTGSLSLNPEGISGVAGKYGEEAEIRAGSVAIAKTDPIRRTLIGIAPILAGLFALSGISYYLTYPFSLLTLLLFYLLFSISNTMFSSEEDMKGVIPVVVTLSLFVLGAYAAGFRFSLTGQAEILAIRILESLVRSLGLVLAVNGVLLLLLKVLLAMSGGRKKMLLGE